MKKYMLSLVLLCIVLAVQYFKYDNRHPPLDGPVCSKGYYPALATDFRLISDYHKFHTEKKGRCCLHAPVCTISPVIFWI